MSNDKPLSIRFGWRHQYDDARDQKERKNTDYTETSESLTEQSHTDEVNLNTMVKRMGLTDGAIPPAVFDPSYYGDFTDVADFRTSLDRVRVAQENFAALPAKLRARFDNNAAKLFAFVSDPENAEEAVRLGLLHQQVTQDQGPHKDPPAPPAGQQTPPKDGGVT